MLVANAQLKLSASMVNQATGNPAAEQYKTPAVVVVLAVNVCLIMTVLRFPVLATGYLAAALFHTTVVALAVVARFAQHP